MGFVLSFLLSWLAVFSFINMRKNVSSIENTFIYLVVLIININVSWIIIEELQYIKAAKDGLNNATFILNRSILLPIIYVIIINLIYQAKSILASLYTSLGSVIVLIAIMALSQYYGIFTYDKWNIWFDAVYFTLLLISIFYINKLFRMSFHSKEGHT